MKTSILTEKAKADFKEIKTEVSVIIGLYFSNKFTMTPNGKGLDHQLATQMFILFCEKNMFRYTASELRRAMALYLDITVYEIKTLSAKANSDRSEAFRSLVKMSAHISVKATTEGWVRSKATQIKFIDRQINILRERKKEINSCL